MALALVSSALATDLIPWAGDLQTAQQAAAKSNRLVLVHFWRDGCPPCRRLEMNVFNQSHVAQAVSAKYVPVKINGMQQPDLAARFGVDRFPMEVIITPSGQIIDAFVSPQDPAQYVATMNGIHARAMAYAAPRVAQNPNPDPRAGAAPADTNRASSWQGPQGAQGHGQQAPQAEQSRYGAATQQGFGAQDGGSRYGQPQSPPQGIGQPPPRQEFSDVRQRPADAALNSSWPPSGQPQGGAGPAGNVAVPNQGDSRHAPPHQGAAAPPSAPMNNPHAASGPQPAGRPVWEWNRQQGPANQPAASASAPSQAPQGNPQPGVPGPTAAGAQPAAPKPALDSFCPVTLVEQDRWQKGDARFGAIHRNRTYLFASPAEQQRFLANPDAYSPVLSGFDPVRFLEKGELVDGSRKHGLFLDRKVYLFADEESLQKFWRSHPMYVAAVQEAMTRSAASQPPQMNR